MSRSWVLSIVTLLVVGGCGWESQGFDGKLAAEAIPAVPAMVVLDASGSMKADDAPGVRFVAAQQAVTSLIEVLPDRHEIGLDVYGTSTGSADDEEQAGCQDIKSVVPFGPLNKASFAAKVGTLKASGYTPIGAALERAAGELPKTGTRAIVLVSDGIDTCAAHDLGPDPCEVAKTLKAADGDLVIHTVGFKVADDPGASEQMACIASATGGLDLDASNGQLLRTRLLAAFNPALAATSIQPSGYRGLELGMKVAEARKVAPKLPAIKTEGRVVIRYVDCDLVFNDGVLIEVRSATDKVRTLDGVQVGDDVSRAEQIYGTKGAPSVPVKGAVTYVADREQGTGYRIIFKPAKPKQVSGKIITISICKCAPGGGGKRVAVGNSEWNGPGSPGPAAFIVDGKSVLEIREPEGVEAGTLVPVGFIGDRAIFAEIAGAHGHTWALVSIDVATGETRGRVLCDACDSVVLTDSEVVAAEVYNLAIHRWNKNLGGRRDVDMPRSRIDQPESDAGDPFAYVTIVAADADATYLATRRVGDPEPGEYNGADTSSRVLKVLASGDATWSSPLQSVASSHAGGVTGDGSSLVVTGFAEGVVVLDNDSLETIDQWALPEVGTSGGTLRAGSVTDMYLTGVPCSACDDVLSAWTWNGDQWRSVDLGATEQVACISDRLGGAHALTSGYGEQDSSLRIRTFVDGKYRQTANLPGAGFYYCAVE